MGSRWHRRHGTLAATAAILALGLTVSCTTGSGQTTTGAPSTSGPPSAATTGTADPGGSAGTTTTVDAPLPHGPFEVKSFQITLTDLTRVTEAGSQTPEKPGRVLETWVFRPDAPGPFPLIVFSHGLGGHPTKFNQLLTAWAKAGFVIAAPAFPLTNNTTPGFSQNWTGVAKQPADVSFVIDQMLARNGDTNDDLHGVLLPDRIGVGGLSLGGATTYGVAFNDCCRDDRVKAVEVLSGAQLPVGGENHLDGHVPLLIVHGDKDPALPYQMEVDGYAKAKGPVWFVTLIGGGHAEPFEDFPSPYDALDEKLTTDFWEGTLGSDPDALARVMTDGAVDGLASIQSK
jgi:dienelactone hydrolase